MRTLLVLLKAGNTVPYPEFSGVVVESGALVVKRRGGHESSGGWEDVAFYPHGEWVFAHYEDEQTKTPGE